MSNMLCLSLYVQEPVQHTQDAVTYIKWKTQAEMDAKLQYPVYPSKLEVGQFASTLSPSYHVHELTQNRGFVGARVSYRENALAYPEQQFQDMWWPKGLSSVLQGKCPCLPGTTVSRYVVAQRPILCLTGKMPLLTRNNSFKICGGPKAYPLSYRENFPCLPGTTVSRYVVAQRPILCHSL